MSPFSSIGYWVFIERSTGRQVEWNDEHMEWLYTPGDGLPIQHPTDHATVEMVRVELTEDRRPITVSEIGLPREPYDDG